MTGRSGREGGAPARGARVSGCGGGGGPRARRSGAETGVAATQPPGGSPGNSLRVPGRQRPASQEGRRGGSAEESEEAGGEFPREAAEPSHRPTRHWAPGSAEGGPPSRNDEERARGRGG